MASKWLSPLLFGTAVLILGAVPLFGQATFSAASSPTVGADIGVTELTGGITLSISDGTSVASSFIIQYSAPITSATLTFASTGGLAAVNSARWDTDSNAIILDIPSGATTGHISMAGVRVALAGLPSTTTTVTATITASNSGNAIVAGQNVLTVISSIKQPFSVTLGNPITWSGGTVVTATSSITVKQTYASVFGVGTYGQTAPPQLRITPFLSIPAGVTITFPETVTSTETGATLTTASGLSETVPRSDGSTAVIYNYAYVLPGSATTVESFGIVVTAAVAVPATAGSLTFQVTLLPITPSVSSTSTTDIPRYLERLVPDETDLTTGSSQLAFPFEAQSLGTYTGIALTNPLNGRVNVTLTAYDANGTVISGAGINNPQTITLPRSGQLAETANEIFGQTFNAVSSGTILATAKTSSLPGFYMEGALSGQGLDGNTAEVTQVEKWTWPSVFHDGPSPTTLLQMFNPGTTPITATLKLFDSSGSLVKSAAPVIPTSGTTTGKVEDLFGLANLNSFSGGYITGTSDGELVVSERFGNALDFNILKGQVQNSQSTFYITHFVSGGGYSTEINIINLSPSTTNAIMTLTAFDDSGNQVATKSQTVAPGVQLLETVDQLFLLGGALVTGYIRVDLQPFYSGPFPDIAPVTGGVRFSTTTGASSALPLFIPASQSFVYSHTAQNLGYYTGIAILNTNATAANVTLQVFTKDGASVGSKTVSVQPNHKITELLRELVPASAGQVGGYVQVQSDQPVISFALFGTDDGKVLSAIPPQGTDQ